MNRLAILIACVALHGAVALATEPGLVAHYAFDEGGGTVAKDLSGQANDGKLIGGVKWVKGPWGTAIELDGKDGYVDGGTGKSLNIAAGGTIMLWCHPKTLQGGLVNWSTGGGWGDQRLVTAVNTYSGPGRPLGVMADGKGTRNSAWAAFNRTSGTTWPSRSTARRRGSTTTASWLAGGRRRLTPNIAGVPMWVGKCQGLGAVVLRRHDRRGPRVQPRAVGQGNRRPLPAGRGSPRQGPRACSTGSSSRPCRTRRQAGSSRALMRGPCDSPMTSRRSS